MTSASHSGRLHGRRSRKGVLRVLGLTSTLLVGRSALGDEPGPLPVSDGVAPAESIHDESALSLATVGGAPKNEESVPRNAKVALPTRDFPGPLSPPAAVMVGGGILLGSFALGSHVMADGGIDNRGVFIVHAGFVAAPLVSHLLVGEGMRGLWFTLVPTAVGVANSLLVESRPRLQLGGKATDRTIYEVMIITGLATGLVGVLDVLGADARIPRTDLRVVPNVGAQRLGLELTGTL